MVKTLATLINNIEINISGIALSVSYFRRLLNGWKPDKFVDTRYYPPETDEDEDVLRYFIFMVAIDHRTSKNNSFEGYVEGEFFHGADLLYRLGMKMYAEDPEFFSPAHMASITRDELIRWLSVKSKDGKRKTVWDPDIRVVLLRNLGKRILKLYEGKVSEIIARSHNYLKKPNNLGLIDRLKAFKAYSDPVEKKSYLFTKFITRRALFRYKDPENSEVPVDNHLTRIALRLGFVKLNEGLKMKIVNGIPFSAEEDIELRFAVRKAYKILSRLLNMDPLILDDLLWSFGRHCCTYANPICIRGCNDPCSKLGLCTKCCVFEPICPSYKEANPITEHNYSDTFYY